MKKTKQKQRTVSISTIGIKLSPLSLFHNRIFHIVHPDLFIDLAYTFLQHENLVVDNGKKLVIEVATKEENKNTQERTKKSEHAKEEQNMFVVSPTIEEI